MIRKEKNQLAWLEFELLADIPNLFHGIFLRHAGLSRDPYHSFNVGKSDDPTHVEQNLEKICRVAGVSHFITGNNIHGSRVALIHSETLYCSRPKNVNLGCVKTPGFSDRKASCIESKIDETDGLITQKKDIGLICKHADCQALLLFDPIHRAIGNIHAGWRGNVCGIFARAISLMQQKFGTKPADLLACISPSLGPTASEFKNYKEELPQSFWEFQVKPTYFDLWEISRFQLIESGILSHHIEIAKICTYSHPEDFYSYRRDKTSGRNATVITLT